MRRDRSRLLLRWMIRLQGRLQAMLLQRQAAQDKSSQASAQGETTANIGGSVLDTNGDTIAGATVVLKNAKSEDRTTVADEYGAFQFSGLQPGIPYLITIAVPDFETWKSEPIVLTPGQFFFHGGHQA